MLTAVERISPASRRPRDRPSLGLGPTIRRQPLERATHHNRGPLATARRPDVHGVQPAGHFVQAQAPQVVQVLGDHGDPFVGLLRPLRGRLAVCRAISGEPSRCPPSTVPRFFAAANAALVPALIASRSCWATTAMTPIVIVFASGKSQATNRTPEPRKVSRKAALRDSRSSLATQSVAQVALHRLMARSSSGRAFTLPDSTSTNSGAMILPPRLVTNWQTESRCASSPRTDAPWRASAPNRGPAPPGKPCDQAAPTPPPAVASLHGSSADDALPA
jgi:hypothetical protein